MWHVFECLNQIDLLKRFVVYSRENFEGLIVSDARLFMRTLGRKYVNWMVFVVMARRFEDFSHGK